MEAKTLIMQRLLLNRFHRNAEDGFLKKIPQDEVKAILNQNIHSQDIQELFIPARKKLSTIHYSWFIPIFEKISEAMRPLLISILPESVSMGLCKHFKEKHLPFSVSPAISDYFCGQVEKELDLQSILPMKFLPPSPLNALTELTKHDLVELIDFLALFDLAEEIKHIVDQKYLKQIYACLSPKKQKYLRVCLHQKVKFSAPKLSLEQWGGDCKKLEDILHRRGMQRLGTALVGQHEDLLKHIMLILDTGRAAIIQKIYAENKFSGISEMIIQQVVSALNFLNKKSQP